MTPLSALPHALDVLAAGADLLDDLDVRWWLSSGTALGAWRDGALIPHDTDLDVGVLDGPQVPPLLDAAFTAAGFVSVRRMPYQLAYRLRDVIFDMYLFRREAAELAADTDCGRLAKPARLVDDLASVELAGRRYPIPNPPEEYLRIRYGPGWRTPTRVKRPWAEDAANLTR